MRVILLSFLTLFMLSGCVNISSPKPSIKQEQKKPYWVEEKTILPNNLAVGYCEPVFGGIYAQRENALDDAQEELSYKIKSTISSKKVQNIKLFGKKIATNSVRNIKDFSQIVLNDIKVYDTYINSSGGLYLLVGLSDAKVDLKKKTTIPFNRNRLKSSSCYKQKTLNSINTLSPMYKNRPLWFYSQDFNTAIGIAQKVDSDFEMQKRTAVLLAKTNLVQKVKSYSLSKTKMMQMLKHNEEGIILESDGLHKSTQKLRNIHLKDIWIDPKTCDIYVFVGI